MIKVEHTKIHLILAMGLNPEKQVLVAPAKLVLVECKSEEALLFRYRSTETIHILPKKGMLVKGLVDYLKPIFISETEIVKESDWRVNYLEHNCITPIGISQEGAGRKILALPEHFSPKHLQDIVDGKLKEGKCLVECEEYTENAESLTEDWKRVFRIKHHSLIYPHITIYPVEEKMYTKEESIGHIVRYIQDNLDPKTHGDIRNVRDWFEQNIRYRN